MRPEFRSGPEKLSVFLLLISLREDIRKKAGFAFIFALFVDTPQTCLVERERAKVSLKVRFHV